MELNKGETQDRLNDVTQYFRKSQEFYSPILGITALETHLIHNLRFYGNFKVTYQTQEHQVRRRDYIKDKLRGFQ